MNSLLAMIAKFQKIRIQRLVKNFFQTGNPNRGILLFHGLGLGKSCAAISIAQANTDRDVIFISKASLEPNFVFQFSRSDNRDLEKKKKKRVKRFRLQIVIDYNAITVIVILCANILFLFVLLTM